MAGSSPGLPAPPVIRRFRTVVPSEGRLGPQPVWRVGTVLKTCLGLSRPERARVWRCGGVTVNGRPVPAQHVHCYPGDVVEAWYPEPPSGVAPEPDLPLRVLYEDEWLLAVDKPAGQLSHPARSEQRGTIANAVAARWGRHEPVRLVHRLDRDTSGVLLFARDAATARSLARQRAQGRLARWYLALVAGRPPASGEIGLWLGPDPAHRTRQLAFAQPGASGAPARTSYRVIQYGPDATLIAAQLHTGRTHQLRAHCAAIGHPLLGDALYGGPPWHGLDRQALHAWRTVFQHPATGRRLAITAPLPDDFRAAARSALGLRRS
jgi:23S rRNA pseudouridine1911/1915/1917 synthase